MTAFTHPFYSLAVRMVTEDDLYASSSIDESSHVQPLRDIPAFSHGKRVLGYVLISPLDFAAAVGALFSTSGWVGSYYMFSKFEGHSAFLEGLRISIGAKLCRIMIPCSITLLMGIYESLLHERILHSISARVPENYRTSQILGSMIHEGSYSVFKYGILTVMQIVPGFLTYIGFRYVLWIIFGCTLKRKREKIVRSKV